jgi:hypothetical protein
MAACKALPLHAVPCPGEQVELQAALEKIQVSVKGFVGRVRLPDEEWDKMQQRVPGEIGAFINQILEDE